MKADTTDDATRSEDVKISRQLLVSYGKRRRMMRKGCDHQTINTRREDNIISMSQDQKGGKNGSNFY